MNIPTHILENLWFTTPITIHTHGIRTASDYTPGQDRTVLANINGQARTITNTEGKEIIVAATIQMSITHPLPHVGEHVTCPNEYGLKPQRTIITSRYATSGTDYTPNHIEITVQ